MTARVRRAWVCGATATTAASACTAGAASGCRPVAPALPCSCSRAARHPAAVATRTRGGEVVHDTNGDMWVCVAAGSPGTWRKIAGPSASGAFHVLELAVRAYDSRRPMGRPRRRRPAHHRPRRGPVRLSAATVSLTGDGHDWQGVPRPLQGRHRPTPATPTSTGTPPEDARGHHRERSQRPVARRRPGRWRWLLDPRHRRRDRLPQCVRRGRCHSSSDPRVRARAPPVFADRQVALGVSRGCAARAASRARASRRGRAPSTAAATSTKLAPCPARWTAAGPSR